MRYNLSWTKYSLLRLWILALSFYLIGLALSAFLFLTPTFIIEPKKVLAILPDLWYTEERSTGDDDRVPCGVMLRIVSGPEGSSTKQILARAAGYAWFESVGFFMHDSSPRSARDFGPSKRGLFYTLQRQKTRRKLPAGIQTK